jgi:hypothetical protein
VFRVVAAILSLGNVTFGPGSDEESSAVPAGKPAQSLATSAELLGVDADGLLRALTTRTRQTPDGPIVSPLDAKAALENRDSLAKILYSKVSRPGGAAARGARSPPSRDEGGALSAGRRCFRRGHDCLRWKGG